jgi:membrane-associated protease RseP (regulator of RpoE activity)
MMRAIAYLLTAAATIGTLAFGTPRDDDEKDNAAAATAKGQDAVVVPFEMLTSNHMVVHAKINGEGPYRLIFDLGSPVILLSGKAAESSRSIPKSAPRSILFGTRGEGKIETLAIGDLETKDLPVIVMDHPALKALGGVLGKPLDGIVGYTFFAHYRTTIDYKAKTLTFVPVDFEVKDLVKDLQQRMMGPKTARTRVVAPRSLFGLSVASPPEDDDRAMSGVAIEQVRDGSPAAKAGVRPGDLLTTLDGRWTTSVADAYAAAAALEPGRPATLVVLRDGRELNLTVTPVEGL